MYRVYFWLIVFISVISFTVLSHVDVGRGRGDEKIAVSLFPGAKKAKYFREPIRHYKVYAGGDRPIGFVGRTVEIEPAVRGYGGEIDLLVAVGLDGKIKNMGLVSHQEAPRYMAIVGESGFLQRMLGLTGEDVLGLDAVTSATISSNAMKKDVSAVVGAITKNVLNQGETFVKVQDKPPSFKDFLIVVPLVLGAFAAFMPAGKVLRWASLVSSVLVVGIILNRPITIGSILDIGTGGFFITANIVLMTILAVSIIMALIKKPFYCSYICPFGMIQELAASVTRKKIVPSETVDKYCRIIRYILVVLVVMSVFLTGWDFLRLIEPFSVIFSGSASLVVWALAGVIVVASSVFGRIWCRCLCPTGLFMEAVDYACLKMRRILSRQRPKPNAIEAR